MRAREIEKWLAKILADGAQELVDAEVGRHIVRVFELVEAIDQRFRPRDALEELRGSFTTPSEIGVSLTLLEARAQANNREWLDKIKTEEDIERSVRETHELYVREVASQAETSPAWWGSSEEGSQAA